MKTVVKLCRNYKTELKKTNPSFCTALWIREQYHVRASR